MIGSNVIEKDLMVDIEYEFQNKEGIILCQ